MSDEEDSDVGSEENEDEDDDEEEEEEEEKEEESDKQARVLEDIETLTGVFQYLGQAARRATHKKELVAQNEALTNTNRQLETKILQLQRCIDQQQVEIARLTRDDGSDVEYPPRPFSDEAVSWSQYESMTEEQRAHLLEKAIEVLGRDDAVPLKSVHRKKK